MANLRATLENLAATFVTDLVAAAQSAPLGDLVVLLAAPARPFLEGASKGDRRSVANSRPRASAKSADAAAATVPGLYTDRRRLRRLDTFRRAVEWQRQLESGEIRSRAAIARREGISRAAVTQTMRALRDRQVANMVALLESGGTGTRVGRTRRKRRRR